jgi:hypothetical protein
MRAAVARDTTWDRDDYSVAMVLETQIDTQFKKRKSLEEKRQL